MKLLPFLFGQAELARDKINGTGDSRPSYYNSPRKHTGDLPHGDFERVLRGREIVAGCGKHEMFD